MAGGDFYVVWEEKRPNERRMISLRGFHADGSEKFPLIRVNQMLFDPPGRVEAPAIACNRERLVVTWRNYQSHTVYARAFLNDGTPLSDEFRVSGTQGGYDPPRVSMAADGTFAIVWVGTHNVYARAFDRALNPLFAFVDVSGVDPNLIPVREEDAIWFNGTFDAVPDIAIADDGSFVVVWGRQAARTYMRGFNPDGTLRFGAGFPRAVGSRFPANPPAVEVAKADGSFTVIEGVYGHDPIEKEVFIHAYDREGWPVSYANQNVSSTWTGWQEFGQLALARSRAVVVWGDDRDVNGIFDVRAREFTWDGVARGDDFIVHSVTTGQQLSPDIGCDERRRFVVVWQDDRDGNGLWEILATGLTLGSVAPIRFSDITINPVSAGQQTRPAVAVEPSIFEMEVVRAMAVDSSEALRLRRFRDNVLMKSRGGQQLVALVDNVGPDVLAALSRDEDLQRRARELVMRFTATFATTEDTREMPVSDEMLLLARDLTSEMTPLIHPRFAGLIRLLLYGVERKDAPVLQDLLDSAALMPLRELG